MVGLRLLLLLLFAITQGNDATALCDQGRIPSHDLRQVHKVLDRLLTGVLGQVATRQLHGTALGDLGQYAVAAQQALGITLKLLDRKVGEVDAQQPAGARLDPRVMVQQQLKDDGPQGGALVRDAQRRHKRKELLERQQRVVLDLPLAPTSELGLVTAAEQGARVLVVVVLVVVITVALFTVVTDDRQQEVRFNVGQQIRQQIRRLGVGDFDREADHLRGGSLQHRVGGVVVPPPHQGVGALKVRALDREQEQLDDLGRHGAARLRRVVDESQHQRH